MAKIYMDEWLPTSMLAEDEYHILSNSTGQWRFDKNPDGWSLAKYDKHNQAEIMRTGMTEDEMLAHVRLLRQGG